mmetsp:Transcript_2267/g.4999  ORF Transcript_2267/g.4999 Transcript_2267/m.4999 type:complete len:212 (-) Transcript_2267:1148-1783(-)
MEMPLLPLLPSTSCSPSLPSIPESPAESRVLARDGRPRLALLWEERRETLEADRIPNWTRMLSPDRGEFPNAATKFWCRPVMAWWASFMIRVLATFLTSLEAKVSRSLSSSSRVKTIKDTRLSTAISASPSYSSDRAAEISSTKKNSSKIEAALTTAASSSVSRSISAIAAPAMRGQIGRSSTQAPCGNTTSDFCTTTAFAFTKWSQVWKT